jgi:plasmid stabilization system protein ParE
MRRRDFIKIIPGLAAAYPLLARAQQSKRRIGVVIARLENDPVAQAEIAALFDNLRQLGWTAGAGGNIQVDYRFPGSNIEFHSRQCCPSARDPDNPDYFRSHQ